MLRNKTVGKGHDAYATRATEKQETAREIDEQMAPEKVVDVASAQKKRPPKPKPEVEVQNSTDRLKADILTK